MATYYLENEEMTMSVDPPVRGKGTKAYLL
jgi:hypothetical protein